MAQVYNKMQIEVRTETQQDIITAVQNDTASRFLDVTLTDNGTPIDLTDHEVRIYCKKFDGTECYNNGEITDATVGRCQFELTDQMLAVAHDISVQITIYYNNVDVLQAPFFTIHVVKSLMSDSAIESSNEYGALVVLYQNLYEAYDLMTEMVQQIGVPGAIAASISVDTMWEAWEYIAEVNAQALANSSVDGVMNLLGDPDDTSSESTVFGQIAGVGDAVVSGMKYLGTKKLTITPATSVSTEIFNVIGQGVILGITATGTRTITNMSIVVDGVDLYNTAVKGSLCIYSSLLFASDGVYIIGNTAVTGATYGQVSFPFNTSVVMTIEATGTASITIIYALYE